MSSDCSTGANTTIKVAEYFYTLQQVADLLEVNRLTVRRWIDAGRIEAQSFGGIVLLEKSAVKALKREREVT